MEIRKNEQGVLFVEDAKLIFKNFAGRPGQYNAAGERSFNLVIDDPEIAQQMRDEGWNVKIKAPREEGDGPFCYLPVSVVFPTPERNFPMRITQFTKNGPIDFTEENVGELDRARFTSCKVAIRPYNWHTAQGSGIKAYLRTMHVVLEEGDFASDYEGFDSMEDPF